MKGMLWFDDNKNRTTEQKIEKAIAHFEGRYGTRPNKCYVHPVTALCTEPCVSGVDIEGNSGLLPNHFWLGREAPPSKIKLTTTPRGFVVGEFKDLYGWECSIQESSLATRDALWLGRDKTPDGELVGSIDKISGQHFGARMHLDIDTAKELILLLQHFVDYGRLPDSFKEEAKNV